MAIARLVAPLAILAATLLSAVPAGAQTTYRWIDPKTGGTVISDFPPPPGARQVTMRKGEESGDAQPLPFAVRQAAEKYPVTLYTAASCVDECRQARELLNGRGVPFSEKMLQTTAEIAELKKLLGGEATVPALSVGRQINGSFAAATWNNLLDLAGYPKNAPYGARPAGSAAP